MNQETKQKHIPVMLNEVLEYLELDKNSLVMDGTLGLGGYTEAILKNSPAKLKVVAFDLDQSNINEAKKRLADFEGRVFFVHANFADMEASLDALGFEKVDAIVLDLGLASTHVDEADRGFSFLKEGDLDMRFDKTQIFSAKDVVNNFSEKELINIFQELGEERYTKRIARAIVEYRLNKKFETTLELADLILNSVPRGDGKIHPATRVFQALRMVVNQELNNLQRVLDASLRRLSVGGRLVIVSYHSLEDRIVKTFFKENAREYVNLPLEVKTTILQPKIKILTKKPLAPTENEIRNNPRSRSAKLRVAQKI